MTTQRELIISGVANYILGQGYDGYTRMPTDTDIEACVEGYLSVGTRYPQRQYYEGLNDGQVKRLLKAIRHKWGARAVHQKRPQPESQVDSTRKAIIRGTVEQLIADGYANKKEPPPGMVKAKAAEHYLFSTSIFDEQRDLWSSLNEQGMVRLLSDIEDEWRFVMIDKTVQVPPPETTCPYCGMTVADLGAHLRMTVHEHQFPPDQPEVNRATGWVNKSPDEAMAEYLQGWTDEATKANPPDLGAAIMEIAQGYTKTLEQMDRLKTERKNLLDYISSLLNQNNGLRVSLIAIRDAHYEVPEHATDSELLGVLVAFVDELKSIARAGLENPDLRQG